MKNVKYLVTALFVLAVMVGPAFSAEYGSGTPVGFNVTASIPSSTGVDITVTKVNATTNVFGSEVFELDFNTAGKLQYNATFGTWLSNYYFAIDVGSVGGSSAITVNTKFADTTSIAGQTEGLGYRATAEFFRVEGSIGSQTDVAISAGFQLLKDLVAPGETVSSTDLTGGFFRVYVGIYDGADATLNAAGGAPFTNDDLPGDYTGVLTITATLI